MSKLPLVIGDYEIRGNGFVESCLVVDRRSGRIMFSGMTSDWSIQWAREHQATPEERAEAEKG